MTPRSPPPAGWPRAATAPGSLASGSLASGSEAGSPLAVGHSAGAGLAAAVAAAALSEDGIDVGSIRHTAREVRAGGTASDSPRTTPAAPSVTTERHDTLWMLAEQYLGSGERYVEIVALNRGVEQPDGRSLRDDGRIYPGWSLSLPVDAVVDPGRPDRHHVIRGDTLWHIAEVELGDPTRYDEIAAVNRGDLQPDGHRLVDPDLILPGWVLEIPGAEHGLDGAAEPGNPSPEGNAAGPAARSGDGDPAAAVMAPIDRAPLASPPQAAMSAPATPAPSATVDTAGVPTLDRVARPGQEVPDSAGEGAAATPRDDAEATSPVGASPATTPPAPTTPAALPPRLRRPHHTCGAHACSAHACGPHACGPHTCGAHACSAHTRGPHLPGIR